MVKFLFAIIYFSVYCYFSKLLEIFYSDSVFNFYQFLPGWIQQISEDSKPLPSARREEKEGGKKQMWCHTEKPKRAVYCASRIEVSLMCSLLVIVEINLIWLIVGKKPRSPPRRKTVSQPRKMIG